MNQPTDILGVVFWLAGGLGLFIYGIEMMGLALRRAAGLTLRKQITRLTQTPIRGLFTGAVLTGLIQSSSATTVMVVGFIHAGLITFPKSIGLILGANIGTTVTPQITTIKLDAVALPLIGIGFIINLLARKRPWLDIGKGIMGFGLLFFGLMIMKLAVGNYHELIQSWLQELSGQGARGWLLMLGGTVLLTAVIQSSSAMVVMIQALAFGGAINDISLAIPMIIGAKIGTCVTAILATLKSNVSAKRAAAAHLMFNVIGAAITLVLLNFYQWFIPKTSAQLPNQIANCHMLIQIIDVVVFLPFVNLFIKLIERLIPLDASKEIYPEFLDVDDIKRPAKALENAKKEAVRLCTIGMEMMDDAVKSVLESDELQLEDVAQREESMDILYHSVVDYVRRIARHDIAPEMSTQPTFIIYLLNNAERIGDHADNIVELGQLSVGDPDTFGAETAVELDRLMEVVTRMGRLTLEHIDHPVSEKRDAVLACRKQYRKLRGEILANHQQQLASRQCQPITGMLFAQVIDNITSVVGHLNHISRAVHRQQESPQQDNTGAA